MPIRVPILRDHVIDDINQTVTVYLHTDDPGNAGTANRVPNTSLGSATITATTGWTVHATNARAEVADDIDFGTAQAAINGVSWYSLFSWGNLLFQ